MEEIEQRIQAAIVGGRKGLQLAEDSIEAAALARGLERPRAIIDGLYERAKRLTAEYGTSHQRLKCAYQRAWTAFWWYEDYERFSELYDSVEQLAKGTKNAYDLELRSSLWLILHSAVSQGKLDDRRSALPKRTSNFRKQIDRLCNQSEQPSAALHARTLRLLVEFTLKSAAKKPIEPVLREFQEIVRGCEGLVGFPLESLVDFLTELGEYLGGLSAYDELFETLLAVQASRKGDIAAARLLLRRGAQQLESDHPYDAIRTLGLSLRRLYKHECRDEAIRALYLSGCAYERVGLLWAARGTLLSAASLAASEFWKYGDVTHSQAACYRRLKWVELRLGRVPQALSWHEVEAGVRRILVEKGTHEGGLSEADIVFDAALGILLLKTEYWELKRLAKIPDSLERLGLFNAWAALLYTLGYETELRDSFFPRNEDSTTIHALFLKWRDQPVSKELPEGPSLYEEQKIILISRLLGCDISVKSDNVPPCVEVAESVLGALESLLSTGAIQTMAVREPILSISVRASDFAQEPFEFDLQDDTGTPQLNIRCTSFDPHSMSSPDQERFKKG